jgi:GT2 family glycosyltransferase
VDDRPTVSISIINWNGREVLLDCLEAIRALDHPVREIVLVDNGSTDGSVEAVRQGYPEVTLIEQEQNRGVIVSRNVGLRRVMETGVDYAWFLDNDIIVDPSSLSRLVEVARADQGVGLVGAKLYHFNKPNLLYSAGGYVAYTQNVHGNRGANKEDRGQYDRLEPVDSIGFACMLVRCKAIEKVGFLDPEYIGYGFGDTDFCTRFRLAGYRVMYCPSAVVWHKHEESPSNRRYTFRKKYLEARNAVRFVKKYANPGQQLKYWFFAILGIPYALVREGMRGNIRGVIGKIYGLMDGLRDRKERALKLFESQGQD